MGPKCHLVLINTAGKQSFIFDTTKRRENVGASHLLAALRDWTRDALTSKFPGPDSRWTVGDSAAWKIVDHPAQVVTDTGGAVEVAVRDPAVGRYLVEVVTRRALKEAPGVDVCGAVGPEFEWATFVEGQGWRISALAAQSRLLREIIPDVRGGRPHPAARFHRLPIVDECAASGFPAMDVVKDGTGERSRQPRSASSLMKRNAQRAGFDRLAESTGISRPDLEATAAHLEDTTGLVAVIHADGNSLGRLFAGVAERPEVDSTAFAETLGKLSVNIDSHTRQAFRAAYDHVNNVIPAGRRMKSERAPVLPLVLGGDDVTVVCDASIALPFAEEYLVAFERLTGSDKTITALVKGGLTACAGVAVVDPHFPFSAAYSLANELADEAKALVKAHATPRTIPDDSGDQWGGGSALSFHVLYDSGGSALSSIRERMTVDGTASEGPTLLTAQPYVVTRTLRESWTRGRHFDDLAVRVAALQQTRDDPDMAADKERALPSSQTHDLRAAMGSGRLVADDRYRQVRRRLDHRGMSLFAADPTAQIEKATLFWPVDDPATAATDPGRRWITGLLDAMNAVDIFGILPAWHNKAEWKRYYGDRTVKS